MAHVLSIRNLSIDFLTPRGPVHALRKVDLAVPRGSIVGIVGESGSGKSTLSLAAMGLLPGNAVVRGGEVLFDGVNVLSMSSRGAARPARPPYVHGLPGSDDIAQSGAVDRRADGRHPVPRSDPNE